MRWPLMGHDLGGAVRYAFSVGRKPAMPLLAHYRLELVHLNLTPVLVCSSKFHAAHSYSPK
jgi:hypothetical protein